MAMKKVVIVEDQRILRDSYKSLIRKEGFDVVCEADDGMAAIKCILRQDPDIVLLDLSLPKMDGMAVLKEVKRQSRRPKVLVLTMNDADEKIAGAFESGADGFCLKDAASHELVFAMNEVINGRRYVSPTIADKVVQGYVKNRWKS
jgi:DNA-binding NarL/FixJ family response regulator